jgi:hypothetical protein
MGEWQKKVEAVLKPHFECVHIQYPHYRRFGALRLLFNCVLLIIGISATVAYYTESATHSVTPALAILAVSAATARYLAVRRREKALAYFQKALQASLKPGERPHIIAHSFGTYLTGRVLKKWEDARFDHVVLTGSVLSQNYEWKGLNKHNRTAVRKVRNERALKDLVAMAVGAMYGTIPEMGYAGLTGFRGDAETIHNTKGPYEPCSICAPKDCALVHNVVHKNLGHSDHFLTLNHALSFWLPFFWDIEPYEYQIWLELCDDAANTEEELGARSPKLAKYEDWLSTEPWRWCEGKTLRDYIHEEVVSHLANVGAHWSEAEIVDHEKTCVRLIWKEVAAATKASQEWIKILEGEETKAGVREKFLAIFKADPELQRLPIGVLAGPPGSGRNREDSIRSLNPRRAVSRVVAIAFE